MFSKERCSLIHLHSQSAFHLPCMLNSLPGGSAVCLCFILVLTSVFLPSWASPMAQMVKNLPAMWETWVQSEFGRSLREGNGYLLQYSCLENPRDRGAWQATVHGIAKSQMSMHALHTHAHTHTHTVAFRSLRASCTMLLLRLPRNQKQPRQQLPSSVSALGDSSTKHWTLLSVPSPRARSASCSHDLCVFA